MSRSFSAVLAATFNLPTRSWRSVDVRRPTRRASWDPPRSGTPGILLTSSKPGGVPRKHLVIDVEVVVVSFARILRDYDAGSLNERLALWGFVPLRF